MEKVTGVGGIFFKCDDPQKVRNWYAQNLGLVVNEYGSLFEFRNKKRPKESNTLAWTPFSSDTSYFAPSKKEFMINYRVENLTDLVSELRKNGVTICDEIQEFDYGKFIHIMDPESNKIELWEPVDKPLIDFCQGQTTH